MTMRQVVMELQSRGYQVEYYKRKDGGILIRRIDGEVFSSGASGNKRARQILGVKISEAIESQLKYATRSRKVKKPSLDDEVYKQFYKTKKVWNKAFKSTKGKPHPAGYFGWKRIKYTMEHYGREEALRRISEAEKYASGYAYTKNIEYLAVYIQDVATKTGSQALQRLHDDLLGNMYSIKEDWIKPAYDELYKLNQGIPPEQVASNVRSILRL